MINRKKLYKLISIAITFGFIMAGVNIINAGSNSEINFSDEIYSGGFNEVYDEEYFDSEYPVMTDLPPIKEEHLLLKDSTPGSFYDDLPPQFSWLDYGGDWTTPAKNQGNCGSCWAFSALGAMEGAINLASHYPDTDIILSEQYILSCLGAAGSCNGGWMHEAIEYIYSTSSGSSGNGINGCPIDSCMPYTATDYLPCSSKCDDWDYFTDPPAPDNKLWQVSNWGWSTFQEDNPAHWDIIKSWIMDYGPISIDFYVSNSWRTFFNNYHSPNDVYQQDDYGITNHGIVVCGWVDDSNILNGGYWIMKNSWGTSGGYNGFFNIAYGCNSVGTRSTTWVQTTPWPVPGDDDDDDSGPGPIWPEMHVFADFSYGPDYPKLGDTIEFVDTSDGDVVLREWDLNGDGVIDSNAKNPTYKYYAEDVYNVSLVVWSSAGLSSTMTRLINVKETWPPFVVATPGYYGGDDFEITFEGRHSYDVDGDIISYHWDFDDGTTSDESHVKHVFNQGDRIYNVALTLTDNEGAQSTKYCDIRIDITVPPTTELVYDLGYLDNDWFKNSQKIFLIAEDWSGISYTMYQVDDGSYQEYSNYFILSDEGQHTVNFYSVDIYGNQENEKSKNVNIDMTPPTLNVEILGSKDGDWYTSSVEVFLTGVDQLSGLNKIIYKMDQGPWETYSSSMTLADGDYRLWAYSVDNAGNNYGSDTPYLIKIDSGAPVSQVFLDGDGSNNIFYKTVNIALSASDQGSGVENIYYSVDGSGFEIFSSPFDIDEIGDHSISFYAVDNIGNREETQSIILTVSDINFDMELAKPTKGLYLMGNRIFNIRSTIIIGSINIEADISSFTSTPSDIQYVEFFIDGVSKMTDSSAPYAWNLNEQMFGTHEIKVTAHNGEGSSITKTIDAMIFIL